jgi:uncharacterized membrane protein
MASEFRDPGGSEMAEEQSNRPEETSEQTNGGRGAEETLTRELKQAIRDAAMEVLGPAAREATTSAAKYAVSKGPELMSKNVMPAMAQRGGPGGIAQEAISKGGQAISGAGGIKGVAGKLMSKLGGGSGGDASGWGRNRRMPVQQWIWLSVSTRHAYNGWTEYKQWPRYMHRTNQIDPQVDDEAVRVKVTEKMWGFTRPFTAEVIEQRPDEHIKWQSTEGTKNAGVINFHEMGPRLTLVEVNLDHSPSGLVEKFARGTRFVKRAVRADFHRFQAWIEMKSDEELDEFEGWRGTIEGGQVVKTHEDAVEEEGGEQDGDQHEYDEGTQDSARDDSEADDDEEPQDEDDEESRGEDDEESRGEGDEESRGEGDEDEAPEGEYDEEPEDEADPEGEAEDEAEEEAPDDGRRRRQPQRQTQRKRPARRAERSRR